MQNSKTLSEVLKDPKKVLFHSKEKINLNFCDIETIDDLPKIYHKIAKLHLSHNKINKLTGIEQFKNITHLSLSYNQLKDWEELLKVENKEALVELNIKGNPFTTHPNHLYLLIEKFPNLQRIDDLKISKEDRYYLQNYWQLSGRILPFYIQLKEDLAIIDQSLQRMKLTVEIRKRDRELTHKERKENIEKLEDLYYQLMHDLKNEHFFIEIHRILEKYTKFQSQSPTLTLKVIDTILQSLYDNRLENIVHDRKVLYTNYRKVFNDLMLKYFSVHDTSLDRFLTQKVLDASFYDHWKFAEDNDYAFDCVLYEFYKLMPNQASISHNINFSFDDPQQVQESERAYGNPRNKVINTLDVTPNNPDFLRNTCVTHFPLFPLNQNYNSMVLKLLLSHLETLESVAVDIYMLLDANSPILKNLGSYRLFLESKMQHIRTRSQTPPNYREYGLDTENLTDTRTRRAGTSLPSNRRTEERLASPNSVAIGTTERRGRSYYLIPKGDQDDNVTSATRTRLASPSNPFLDTNNPEGLTTMFGSGNKYSGSRRIEEGEMFTGKRRNVLPLLIIVKFDSNDKVMMKEGFYRLKEYSRAVKKAERKIVVQEFYQSIRDKLDNNLKTRIMERWHERAKSKRKLLSCFREIRRNRLARYFQMLNIACYKSRKDVKFYYMKNLALKVFYSILHLRMKKRAVLRKVLDKFTQKRLRIVNLYLSKWRLVNSALKYASKKTSTMKNINEMMATKRRQSSSDSRKYKDLKNEALRLQSKKTLRELEPYFSKDKDIFRKCSACDYEI